MSRRSLMLIITSLALLIFGAILLVPIGTETLPVIKASEGEAHSYAVYTEDGDILYLNEIEKIKKSLRGSYVVNTEGLTIENPIGIIENPPSERITYIYDKVLEAINNDHNVLIIYIDGLGYELYKNAVDSGKIPYIASLGMGAKALTVYPSITDVTFAAMVTGKTPKYTGIHNRDKKPLSIPTIFDVAAEKGKTSKLIEGNMKIIIDEVQTVLNIDENKNRTIDDEIYNCAMKEIEKTPHILMIHFHSYDDFAHKYGPNSEEVLAQLGVLDSYIENIVEKYSGDVIITADHGMHSVDGAGEHGTFSPLDMFIPIIDNN